MTHQISRVFFQKYYGFYSDTFQQNATSGDNSSACLNGLNNRKLHLICNQQDPTDCKFAAASRNGKNEIITKISRYCRQAMFVYNTISCRYAWTPACIRPDPAVYFRLWKKLSSPVCRTHPSKWSANYGTGPDAINAS